MTKGEPMSDQPEPSVAAARARQSVLSSRHSASTDADRVLTEVLASAHASARESLRRLDAITEQIDRATAHQAGLAVDTPLGAREFQRFLATKQREIAAIVADARELDRSNKAVLENLQAQYGVDAG
jgi:membrane-bound lytic murein transglycosylase B